MCFILATFGAVLKFLVKDCDPTTGNPESEDGYDDEYILEDLEITVADQIQKTKKSNFAAEWEAADSEGKFHILSNYKACDETFILFFVLFLDWVEAEDTFALSSVSSIQEAVNTVVKFLGFGAANATEKVSDSAKTHTLLCSGNFYFIIKSLTLQCSCEKITLHRLLRH